jgi:hypothetical protein
MLLVPVRAERVHGPLSAPIGQFESRLLPDPDNRRLVATLHKDQYACIDVETAQRLRLEDLAVNPESGKGH